MARNTTKLKLVDLHSLTLQGETALIEKELKKAPERVNEKDKVGFTLLHLAASREGADTLLFLLSCRHIDIQAVDREGKAPLHCAAALGRTQNAEILLEHDADINAAGKNGWTALHCCAVNGKHETIDMLIRKGAAFRADQGGYFPLYYSIRYGHLACAEAILQGAGENLRISQDTQTPLHISAGAGHLAMTKYLLNLYSIEVNAVTREGDTALHIACEKGYIDIAEALVSLGGASLTIMNNRGLSAVSYIKRADKVTLQQSALKYVPRPKEIPVRSEFVSKIITPEEISFIHELTADMVDIQNRNIHIADPEPSINSRDIVSLEGILTFTEDAKGADVRVLNDTPRRDSSEATTPQNEEFEQSAVCIDSSDLIALRQYAQTSQLLQSQLLRLATRLQAHEETLKTLVGKYKECPNLLWFYPKEKKYRDWLVDPLHRLTGNPIMIAFVCPVSLNVVKCGPNGTGWEVKNPKLWVKKWGPVLMTTIKVLQVATVAGRLLTGIPIPMPNAKDLGLGCIDYNIIQKSLDSAWTIFSVTDNNSSNGNSFESSLEGFDQTVSPAFSSLLDDAYRDVHQFVTSAEANEGKHIVLEDHLRDELVRVMSPITGAVEWVSPAYVEVWLDREAVSGQAQATVFEGNCDEYIGESKENTAKIIKLEEEIDSLKQAVENVIKTNLSGDNKKNRNSRDISVNHSFGGGGHNNGSKQIQLQLKRSDRTSNVGMSRSGGIYDSFYIQHLEKTLVETQEQLLRLTTDFELYREDQQVHNEGSHHQNQIHLPGTSSDLTQNITPRRSLLLHLRERTQSIDMLQGIIQEGELAKISGKKYKHYYFVLTNEHLWYFSPDLFSSTLVIRRKIPLELIRISGCEVVHMNMLHSFLISSSVKSFYLEADSEYMKNIWYQAISVSVGSVAVSIPSTKRTRKRPHLARELSSVLEFERCCICKVKIGFLWASYKRCPTCLYCKCNYCYKTFSGQEIWEAVTDPASSLVYWWNPRTNATTSVGVPKPTSLIPKKSDLFTGESNSILMSSCFQCLRPE